MFCVFYTVKHVIFNLKMHQNVFDVLEREEQRAWR